MEGISVNSIIIEWGNKMMKERIDNEIKDLNSTRAKYHRDFMDIEKKYNEKIIPLKVYEKHKKKYADQCQNHTDYCYQG